MLMQMIKPLFGLPAYEAKVEVAPFTPDIWKIEQYEFQNVFIYNEFMYGCSGFADNMDGSATRQCIGVTHDDTYVLWKKNLGDLTSAFALPIGPEQKAGQGSLLGIPSRIMGQVFSVRPGLIKSLDDRLQNGVMFKRERIKIDIPFRYKNGRTTGDAEVHTIPAWAYIGNMPYWMEQMDPLNVRCSPVKQYFPNVKGRSLVGPYYYFAEKNERNYK